MLKKNYITLSIVFFSIAFVILMYLFSGNMAAIAGQISVTEAANRWMYFKFMFPCLIAGGVFAALHVKAKNSSYRAQSAQNRGNYYQNRNGAHRPDFNGNSNCDQEFMEDLTRQQHQQFMDEANMQQHQQFMDDMNMQQQQFMDEANMQQQQQFMDDMNMQQQQQFMDDMNMQQQQQFDQWSTNESLHSVDNNFPQGFF